MSSRRQATAYSGRTVSASANGTYTITAGKDASMRKTPTIPAWGYLYVAAVRLPSRQKATA
jgi:hypothetical protein